MNIMDTHWAMGVINIRDKGFHYFDSMTCRPHPNFPVFLRRYVDDEHKAKKGGPLDGVDGWDMIDPAGPVPQQENGYDCGVFTCFFADYLSSGRVPDFHQDDMKDLRMRLAARVVSGRDDWNHS